MELREAKKPLTVESSPAMARATTGRPMSGERKMLSILPLQEKKGVNPRLRFSTNLEKLKSLEKRR